MELSWDLDYDLFIITQTPKQPKTPKPLYYWDHYINKLNMLSSLMKTRDKIEKYFIHRSLNNVRRSGVGYEECKNLPGPDDDHFCRHISSDDDEYRDTYEIIDADEETKVNEELMDAVIRILTHDTIQKCLDCFFGNKATDASISKMFGELIDHVALSDDTEILKSHIDDIPHLHDIMKK
jgi:hypothetical protein